MESVPPGLSWKIAQLLDLFDSLLQSRLRKPYMTAVLLLPQLKAFKVLIIAYVAFVSQPIQQTD